MSQQYTVEITSAEPLHVEVSMLGAQGPPGPGGPDPVGASAGYVWTADGANGADWQAPPSGGGGGAVDSVNTQTGDVVLDAGDVGADPAGAAASAQTAAESTAAAALVAHHAPGSADHDDRYTPTSSLAAVATSGAYSDLTGRPTLGSAAATDTGDYATAAQGALADSAVQPGALGTAAPLDVAVAGDAAAGEVVKGDDTRLTDARTPTAHNHDGVYDPAGSAAAAQSAAESTAAAALTAHHDPTSADHDDRYYTETEVDAALTGKADTGHNHDGSYAATGHSHSGTDDHTHTAYETAVQEDQTYPGITTIALVTEAQMTALAGSEDPNTYYVVVPNP